MRRVHLIRSVCVVLLLLALGAPAGAQYGFGTPPGKLPQDTGVAALQQMLRRLQTTAHLMETTAHPDDEDGGMLTLESRGKGVTVLSLTLTRGEGGQNRTGSNLFDVLGILRTLEVMASDRYYGAEQRFTHVADFGFSKTPEETLQKWDGGQPALADMVRVIREFRPDVIVSRFQGSARDGHGHHQASGILTREAFRAAADPIKFPEQIHDGLRPWQAKKLYIDNVRGSEDYTLALNSGAEDPVLGMSYVQLAVEGLKHQQSQGVGFRPVSPGPRLSYYKLVDSVLPPLAAGVHEKDFFDGVDISLPGLASRLGDEESRAAFLRPALEQINKKIGEAVEAAQSNDPSRAAMPLIQALVLLNPLVSKLQDATVNVGPKNEVLSRLSEKQEQLNQAISLALGLELDATVRLPRGVSSTRDNPYMAVPGAKFTVSAVIANHGLRAVQLKAVRLQGPTGWRLTPLTLPVQGVEPGREVTVIFQVDAPAKAQLTQPYEHRNDPERDAIYTLDEPQYDTLPFPPPPLKVTARYVLQEACGPARRESPCPEIEIEHPVEVRYSSADSAEDPLAVAPAFSVLLAPGTQVVPIGQGASTEVTAHVHSNLHRPAQASLQLELPAGWRSDPATQVIKFDGTTDDQTSKFKVFPAELKERTYAVKAVLDYGGKQYAEGYSVVTRDDLGEFFYYQPAAQRISAVALKLPPGLKVGYIMGAGDDIPNVLQQAGLDVHMITPEELASGDLGQFGTVVVGIRAYDVREDVRAHNQRLLDYVSAGGTLVVQYNANTTEFNARHYTPYPAELSHERVTVEEAPVEVLAPADSLLHFPNQITAQDFDGWVQERGLYFMDKWDEHFEPLLACHDPGEALLKGGLLRARYGKGTYIYAGYAFFRQLPAGVPGAVRLFVNLLSAGHEQ